jgi:hypothetical protein
LSGSESEKGDAPYQKSSKNYQKMSNLIIMTLKKKRKSNIFFKKYALKCHACFIVGIVKERIFIAGSETGSLTFY